MGQTCSSHQLYELRIIQSLSQQPPILIPRCQYCTNCPAYQPMSLMGLRWEPRCETFSGLEKFQRMNRVRRRKSVRKCVGIVVHPQGDPRPRTQVLITGRDAAVDWESEITELLMLGKRDEVVSAVPRGEQIFREEVHRSWEEYVIKTPLAERRKKVDVKEWEVQCELQLWKAGERSKIEFGGLRCGRSGGRR